MALLIPTMELIQDMFVFIDRMYLKATSGCDSTAVLDLTILKSDTTTSSIISCQSYTWNGQIIDSSGIYTQTRIGINGCDSTHLIDVFIGLPDSVSSTITQCDSIVWNGLTTSSSIYTTIMLDVTVFVTCWYTHSIIMNSVPYVFVCSC